MKDVSIDFDSDVFLQLNSLQDKQSQEEQKEISLSEIINDLLRESLENNESKIVIKCADCGCLPSECKESLSPKECPRCSWDECCCWAAFHVA